MKNNYEYNNHKYFRKKTIMNNNYACHNYEYF